MTTPLTKAEVAEVAHAAAQKNMPILIALQRLTEKMDLSGGRK